MNALTLLSGVGFDALTTVPMQVRRFATALQIARERRQLGQLDDRMLADLGLSEGDATREASRPIWDIPANR